MAALIGLFVGAFAGHMLWRDWGAAIGGVIGFIAGAKLNAMRTAAKRPVAPPGIGSAPSVGLPARDSAMSPAVERALILRVAELERRVAVLEQAPAPDRQRAETAAPSPLPQEAGDDMPQPSGERSTGAPTAPAAKREGGSDNVMDVPVPASRLDAPVATATVVPATASRSGPGDAPRAAERALAKGNPLWAWFTGGNALTRIGVVVLFFGVAFLLKYFAEHFTLPIEMRLAGVAACGLVLVALGMRFAASRPGYGLSLQGAGVGILYLTTFAAFRLYGVLPELPTIALLVAVSALTVHLAMRNDSQPLAGLAIAGGFLAPMLVATQGEPLPLFSYFVVLNGAVLALAWKRAWRALNAVGFVFTFVLAAYWGHEYYRPDYYAVVQPFLAAFFVFYVAIAILYARRGGLVAKDPVDGLLVFGVPLVAFALQTAIVRDARYGAAWSALAMAAMYALLFLALRRRDEPGFALLSRAFLVLAVIFATMAIPFAFDNRATAALWAVEAAGVYWIGVRQEARLARVFALVIELGAGIAFIVSGAGRGDVPLFANAFFAGALLIGASGIVTARIADRAGESLPARERDVIRVVFAWGVLWWLAAGGVELARHLSHAAGLHAVLGWVTASVAMALLLASPLRWDRLRGAGVALLPAMVLAAIGDFERARTTLTYYGWLVWPCAWVVHWLALRVAELPRDAAAAGDRQTLDRRGVLRTVHTVSALLLVAQIAWEASEWTARTTSPHTAWTPCAAALPAIAFLWLCLRYRESAWWPMNPQRDAYASGAGKPIAGLLALWFFMVNVLSPGDPSPLPFVPLANPLDVTLLLALAVLIGWARRYADISERALYRFVGAGLFVALNGIVLRIAHQWGDIPWRWGALLASKPLQAALTLTWTATALALMYVATRRRMRPLWMVGAALLAVVVGKLFLVDLGALSGLPRVIAFLGVGILLLVIGFLSPLPPSVHASDREDAPPPA